MLQVDAVLKTVLQASSATPGPWFAADCTALSCSVLLGWSQTLTERAIV